MEHLVQPTLDFISAHSSWAVAVMFVTAFGESFAFVSLLFPGTSMLIAAGALMAAGSLPYLPIIAGAVVGAVLGDTVSFWIGHRYGGGIARVWPFTRSPELLPNGIRFFARHGGKSVFVGDVGDSLVGSANTVVLVLGGLTLFGVAGVVWAAMKSVRPKT